ncbi:integrin-alpha FG-GAP repeat-containing protein 2 [Striga asiatica]|uniref:Integrin-alpha FG-GAP repeat-containing protein 2 n=1 Tax=Striga asiatica TaxID=4170 RepID=A0A5A7RCM9_STRAF|nr:integrin-alpha FG-GAP repeat-containing protein 2 [Striga asiatica]
MKETTKLYQQSSTARWLSSPYTAAEATIRSGSIPPSPPTAEETRASPPARDEILQLHQHIGDQKRRSLPVQIEGELFLKEGAANRGGGGGLKIRVFTLLTRENN